MVQEALEALLGRDYRVYQGLFLPGTKRIKKFGDCL